MTAPWSRSRSTSRACGSCPKTTAPADPAASTRRSPSARPEDLGAALTAAGASDRAVVPDAEGTGTTLVTAASGIPLLTSFGARSYARHIELGCVPLEIAVASSLRHDVDTAAQLEVAAELG